MNSVIEINTDTCTGCGLCSKVCSRKILKMNNGEVKILDYPDWGCCQCGLCMSVCPSQSIQIAGLDYSEFAAPADTEMDFEDLEALLSSRRSIRSYKDKGIDHEVLDKVIRASALPPIGSPPTNAEVLVISKREHINELYQDTVRCWKKTMKSMKNPIYRVVSRRVAGANQYQALTNHALPSARVCCESADSGKNIFTFDAPVIILFHGNKLGVCIVENCWLAASYACIAAHALGLGSIFSGMIPPIVNMNSDVKDKYGIPAENNVYSCLMLGYPAVKFRRRIPREHKDVRYLNTKPFYVEVAAQKESC